MYLTLQRQYSVTQAITVNNRKIPMGITRYETTINGQPVYGGANDPRMGDIHNISDPGELHKKGGGEIGRQNRN